MKKILCLLLIGVICMGLGGCATKLYSEEEILKGLRQKYDIDFVVFKVTPLKYDDYFKEAIAETRKTFEQEYSYLENTKFIKYDISTSEFTDLSFEVYSYISHSIMAGSLDEPWFSDNIKEVYFVNKFEQWTKEIGISYSITNPRRVHGQSRDIGDLYRIFIDYTVDDIDLLSQELVEFLYMMKKEPLIAVSDEGCLSVEICPRFTSKDGTTTEISDSYLTLSSYNIWIGFNEPDDYRKTLNDDEGINENSVKMFFEYFANK